MDLFKDSSETENERDVRLDKAMDSIRSKLGDDAIRRASGMGEH